MMMEGAWWIGILFLCLIGTSSANSNPASKKQADNTRASVGRFSIPINDDRIGDWKANLTLINHLLDLYDSAWSLWLNENVTLPTGVEASQLMDMARQNLSDEEYHAYAQPLMDLANQTLQADTLFLLAQNCSGYLDAQETAEDAIPTQLFISRCDWYNDSELIGMGIDPDMKGNKTAVDLFMNATYFDLYSEYVQAVYNTSILTQFYSYGALMGLGWTVPCSEQVNIVLENKDEWAKAGSAAATTLMALLPTFLAFGNLFVPRSSEVFATSSLVGIGSSLYSFGLPVQSLSVIPDKQNLELATFGLATLALIASFADLRPRRKKPRPPPTLKELQDWSVEKDETTMTSMDEAKHNFAQIKESVIEKCAERWHWWYLPSLFIVAAQAVMFALAMVPLLTDIGTPRFFFTCYTNWTGAYLAITASANAVFRFCMWEVGYHERVLLYSFSPATLDSHGRRKFSEAERKLRELIAIDDETDLAHTSDKRPSMQTELPPLYPPLMTRIWASIGNIFGDPEENNPRYAAHLDVYKQKGNQKNWLGQVWDIFSRASRQVFKNNIYHVKYMLTSVGKIASIEKMLKPSSQDLSNKARRYRPLVLLIHLSTKGRNFFNTLMSGFVEASLYLVLTFFLASQWGGNLVVTGFALSLLLIFVTTGRALGLFYVWLSTKIWGLTLINCDSHEEILGSLRIICSMKEVLVCVNGAFYYNGYRLNGLKEFEKWQDKYDAGKFDNKSNGFEGNYKHDIELGTIESPRPEVEHEITTRVEVQRRQPFLRTETDQTESKDRLVQHGNAKKGLGSATADVYERTHSIDSRSRVYDSE